MKTLILSLMMTISQASFAGGNSVGSMSGSSAGNFLTVSWGSVGTMGGSEVGNFKSVGIGFGNMGNGSGTMGTGQGNMDNLRVGNFAGGAEANKGGAKTNGGHEV